MQDIRTVDVDGLIVSSHFIDHQLDEINITVIRRKMERSKELICRLNIDPLFKLAFTRNSLIRDVVLQGVVIDHVEAFRVVLEGSERQSCVCAGFLGLCHIYVTL